MQVLAGIESYCIGVTCRHRAIVRYFGQQHESDNCGACDVCLGEIDEVSDSLVISQKILSCVARLNESFGGEYTAHVLVGSKEERIRERGHDSLSTWGILADHDKKSVRGWIDQLVSQQFLNRTGEYSLLQLTPAGWRVLRGEITPRLLRPPTKTRRSSRAAIVSWEGVDRGLFDVLRSFRRDQAEMHGVPPYVIFSDATLRDLARERPTTPAGLLAIRGIGEKKAAAYGTELVRAIKTHCEREGIQADVPTRPLPLPLPGAGRGETRSCGERPVSAAKRTALDMFARGESIDAVQQATRRARSTVSQYLVEFIKQDGIVDVSPWIDDVALDRIRTACQSFGHDRLKPIFEALGGDVPYDQIRIAMAALRNEGYVEAEPQ
jgi:ATP-dependent DNA helicase RecQ